MTALGRRAAASEIQGGVFDAVRRLAGVSREHQESAPPRALRHRLPQERASLTHKFAIAGHEGYITVGLYKDGIPGEQACKQQAVAHQVDPEPEDGVAAGIVVMLVVRRVGVRVRGGCTASATAWRWRSSPAWRPGSMPCRRSR